MLPSPRSDDCPGLPLLGAGGGTRLAGNATLGAHSLIGAGAVVIPGVRIGADVTVGAGAAVTYELTDGLTVVGVPATPKD